MVAVFHSTNSPILPTNLSLSSATYFPSTSIKMKENNWRRSCSFLVPNFWFTGLNSLCTVWQVIHCCINRGDSRKKITFVSLFRFLGRGRNTEWEKLILSHIYFSSEPCQMQLVRNWYFENCRIGSSITLYYACPLQRDVDGSKFFNGSTQFYMKNIFFALNKSGEEILE